MVVLFCGFISRAQNFCNPAAVVYDDAQVSIDKEKKLTLAFFFFVEWVEDIVSPSVESFTKKLNRDIAPM